MPYIESSVIVEIVDPPCRSRRSRYVLKAPVSYLRDNGDIIKVPEGYITDLASIPLVFSPILPPDGKYAKPSIIHDFLCSESKCYEDRVKADIVFFEAMTESKVRFHEKWIIYIFVRAYGIILYKLNKRHKNGLHSNKHNTK